MKDQKLNKSLNNTVSSDFIKEDEVDISEIFKSIQRNKLIVFIFCFFSLVFSSYLVLNTKRTYQGEFQIVLAKEKPLLRTNKPELAALNIGLNNRQQLKLCN